MSNIKKTIITAMLIAVCVVLPMAFHMIPMAGIILLPMHIPVLLAGLVCGPLFGLAAGMIAPVVSHFLTGMPPQGILQGMIIELGVYGFISGFVLNYVRTKRASFDLYIALISAMLAGRIIGGVFSGMFFVEGSTISMWVELYFVTALPGIVIQLAFIPSVVMALERERVIPLRYPIKA